MHRKVRSYRMRRSQVSQLQAELKRGAEEEPKPDDARLIVPATDSLIMDPDGDLRGGTVEGLIERLFLDAGGTPLPPSPPPPPLFFFFPCSIPLIP
jgi:hypothetical protein